MQSPDMDDDADESLPDLTREPLTTSFSRDNHQEPTYPPSGELSSNTSETQDDSDIRIPTTVSDSE